MTEEARTRTLAARLSAFYERIRTLTPSRVWEAIGIAVLAVAAAGAATLFHAMTVWIEAHSISRFEAIGTGWFVAGSLASVVTGSALASLLISRFAPRAGGGGVLPVKLAYWKEFGVLGFKEAVVKIFGSALTLGSGVSLGPEGPSIQIGAAVLSGAAGVSRVAKQGRRVWCAAGAAAGLAAVFNAPLAAISFVLEEVVGDLHSRLIGRIVVAAIVGALVAHAVLGPQPAFQAGALGVIGWRPWLVVPFVAVLAAFGGAVFQKAALRCRRSLLAVPRGRLHAYRPVLGALVTWGAGVTVYLLTGHAGIFGVGYADITGAIAGNLVWTTALALFLGKIVATAGAVGTGGCGGIFAPSLFIGATAGAALSSLASFALPLGAGERSMLVMIGMAASLGAVIRTPITCILLIFEVTNQWVIVPALLVAVVISQVVAGLVNRHDMYEDMMLQDGIDPNQALPPRHFKRWQEIPVSALASFKPILACGTSPGELADLLARSSHQCFPVRSKEGRIVGVLERSEASRAIALAREPVLKPGLWIAPKGTVGDARRKMLSSGVDFLCVGDESGGQLEGVLTLHDLLRGESVLEDDTP